jgi:CHAD domain-containing protein
MEHVESRTATPGENAGRLLTRRIREMFRVYPKALVGDVEAVHDLRVTARRLRSAVQLLADKPEGRRARRADKTLRDLARTAGRGRDLDVGLEVLQGMPRGIDEGAARLLRSLRASRARARVLSREALMDLDFAHLRRDLRALAASTRLDRSTFAARHEALSTLLLAKMTRDLSSARGGEGTDALHRARRAARRLRYAAELSALMEGADPGAADGWRKLQAQLGKIQDRRVLAEWLASRIRLATARNDQLLARAASRVLMRIRRDVTRLSREFLSAPLPRSVEPTPPPVHSA